MKTASAYRIQLSIAAATLAIACLSLVAAYARDIETAGPHQMTRWYGNAGGPAGGDAIASRVRGSKALRSGAPDEMYKWYGNAAGPIDLDAVAAGTKTGPSVTAEPGGFGPIYGRVGWLSPGDSVAAITRASGPQAGAMHARSGDAK